jgi:hypothetical protein
MNILVLLPTRGRLQKAFTTLATYPDLAADNSKIKYVVAIDEDDVEMIEAKSKFEKLSNAEVIVGKRLDKIPKFDRDIHTLTYDWQIVIATADDMVPLVKGWDTIIREDMLKYFPDLDGSLFYNDGLQGGRLNTLPIMGRKYFNRFKYIWYPKYKSQYCDTEFTAVGKMLGKLKYNDSMIIRHEHPSAGFGKRDYVHKDNGINAPYDKGLFLTRKENNFDLVRDGKKWTTK